jgi:hypothetical protein
LDDLGKGESVPGRREPRRMFETHVPLNAARNSASAEAMHSAALASLRSA